MYRIMKHESEGDDRKCFYTVQKRSLFHWRTIKEDIGSYDIWKVNKIFSTENSAFLYVEDLERKKTIKKIKPNEVGKVNGKMKTSVAHDFKYRKVKLGFFAKWTLRIIFVPFILLTLPIAGLIYFFHDIMNIDIDDLF